MTDKKKIKALELKVEELFSVGIDGIMYVGSANYAERESEALYNMRKAMSKTLSEYLLCTGILSGR